MKTKILYVLVSSEKDYYVEQARISIASVRHHNKSAHICLMTDQITMLSLTGIRALIKDEVDEIIIVNLPEKFSPNLRSRILKTSARQNITGNFLFIDTDTIILKSLDEIDDWNFEIGACYDSHSMFPDNPYRNMCVEHCKLLGKDISEEMIYYNSGVIFVKDSPVTRSFYKNWFEKWQEGVQKGINMDQPSFELTNLKFNYIITRIPDIWNCQILHGIKVLPKAKILHYLCTNSNRKGDIFTLRGEEYFEYIKENGIIPESVITLFDDPFEGIPSLTHLHGGDSVYIFRSTCWQVLQRIFQLKSFKSIERGVSIFIKVLSCLKHPISSFKRDRRGKNIKIEI